jgi:hypothetical protein
MGKEIEMDAMEFGMLIGSCGHQNDYISGLSKRLLDQFAKVEGFNNTTTSVSDAVLDQLKEDVSDLWTNMDGSHRPSGELLIIREVNKKIDRLKEKLAT